MDARTARLKTALDALYFSGAYRAMAPFTRGRGMIFMLHQVVPGAAGTRPGAFAPNAGLSVTPEFLDLVIGRVREAGFDLVDLDEAARRLRSGSQSPFACFTLDDGYRDNRDYGLPVFERHDCPFTVYVVPGFAARTAPIWWIALERILSGTDVLRISFDARERQFDCPDAAGKIAAFEAVTGLYNAAGGEAGPRLVEDLLDRHGFDAAALAAELTMDWDELADFGRHPLATLGAHTLTHPVLANLSEDRAGCEIDGSASEMETRLGARPRHFAYPYGHAWAAGPRDFGLAGRAGFHTAVTTRKGVLHGEHGDHLFALPRVSLNGDYQQARYLDVLLSGAAFALLNRFRRVDAA